MLKIKKIVQLLSYYILPISLAIFSTFRLIAYSQFVQMGNVAFLLLLFVLFIKPLALVLNIKFLRILLSFRREVGVAIFWIVIFHVGGMLFLNELFDTTYFINPADSLFWGLLGLLGVVVLGLTSNNFSVRLLKRSWKTVQKIAYPVLVLVVMHRSITKADNYTSLYVIIGIYVMLKALEWSKVKIEWKKV